MHGLAELNKECWDREHLSQAEQPASKRFQLALGKAIPCPIERDEGDDEVKGDGDDEGKGEGDAQ